MCVRVCVSAYISAYLSAFFLQSSIKPVGVFLLNVSIIQNKESLVRVNRYYMRILLSEALLPPVYHTFSTSICPILIFLNSFCQKIITPFHFIGYYLLLLITRKFSIICIIILSFFSFIFIFHFHQEIEMNGMLYFVHVKFRCSSQYRQ